MLHSTGLGVHLHVALSYTCAMHDCRMPCSGVAPSQLPRTKRVLHGYDLKHCQLPKLLVLQDSWQDHLWPANRLQTHHNQCTSQGNGSGCHVHAGAGCARLPILLSHLSPPVPAQQCRLHLLRCRASAATHGRHHVPSIAWESLVDRPLVLYAAEQGKGQQNAMQAYDSQQPTSCGSTTKHDHQHQS